MNFWVCILSMAWMVLAAVSYIKGRKLFLTIYLLFFGLIGISGCLFNQIYLMLASTILCPSLLLMFIPAAVTTNIVHCSEKVEATYLCADFVRTARGLSFNVPVFRYSFDGKAYERPGLDRYYFKSIEDAFNPGYRYEIYINPSKPEICVHKRKTHFSYILYGFFGILMLAFYLLVLWK